MLRESNRRMQKSYRTASVFAPLKFPLMPLISKHGDTTQTALGVSYKGIIKEMSLLYKMYSRAFCMQYVWAPQQKVAPLAHILIYLRRSQSRMAWYLPSPEDAQEAAIHQRISMKSGTCPYQCDANWNARLHNPQKSIPPPMIWLAPKQFGMCKRDTIIMMIWVSDKITNPGSWIFELAASRGTPE